MIALWMAVVGVMLLAIGYAFSIPAHIRQDTDLRADEVAMQVYIARDYAQNYFKNKS